MLESLRLLIHSDIQLTRRQAHAWLTPLLFFVIVVSLFPLALSTDQQLLQTIAPGILWVAALLSLILSMGRLFQADAETGHLDLLIQSPVPLPLLVLCKVLSHWLLYGLPLILICPVLGIMLHLPTHTLLTLILTLLLGTPLLCLLGAIGAGLVVNLRHHGLLLPVLIMPLYIPVLILGTGAVMTSAPLSATLALLGAYNLLALAFAPWLTGLALRMEGAHGC